MFNLRKSIKEANAKSPKPLKVARVGEDYVITDEKSLDPGFRRIAKHLLNTDVRKHNKYCPCCKQYDQDNELSPD
jgi:hypothetical protein